MDTIDINTPFSDYQGHNELLSTLTPNTVRDRTNDEVPDVENVERAKHDIPQKIRALPFWVTEKYEVKTNAAGKPYLSPLSTYLASCQSEWLSDIGKAATKLLDGDTEERELVEQFEKDLTSLRENMLALCGNDIGLRIAIQNQISYFAYQNVSARWELLNWMSRATAEKAQENPSFNNKVAFRQKALRSATVLYYAGERVWTGEWHAEDIGRGVTNQVYQDANRISRRELAENPEATPASPEVNSVYAQSILDAVA